MKTIEEQISYLESVIYTLEIEAGTNGDLLMAAICQIARTGAPAPAALNALDHVQLSELLARFSCRDVSIWDRVLAFQECNRIITRNSEIVMQV